MTTEEDLHALAHADPPRLPLADKAHDMLQRQIDALLTHARTVTHQIADLTIRSQRHEAEISATMKQLDRLSDTVSAHMEATDKRATHFDGRIDAIEAGQTQILTAVNGSADLMRELRDMRTVGVLLGRILRSTGGLVAAIGVIGAALLGAVQFIRGAPPF